MTRTGRPPFPAGVSRERVFRLKMNEQERAQLWALAEAFGETPSQCVRRLIEEAKAHIRQ